MSAGSQLLERVHTKALLVLVIAAVLVVVITAVISPGIISVLHSIGIAGAGLDEVAIRTLELVAIALTFIALMLLGGSGKAAWGLRHDCVVARRLGIGFAFGVLSLGMVCVVLYAFDVRVVRHDVSFQLSYWIPVLAVAMLSAAVVGVLEEVWFRGGLFTLLHRCSGVTAALFGGSVIYAGAHFLAVPGGVHSGEAQALTAFEVLEAAAQNVFQMQHLDSFVALFIAGVTLGLVRLRQGDVVMCMGIHAGWVLTIKVFKKLTYLSPAQTNRFLAGHYDDVVGWTASVCLLVMLIFVWRYMRPSSSSMASSAPRPRSQPELSPQMQQHPPRE